VTARGLLLAVVRSLVAIGGSGFGVAWAVSTPQTPLSAPLTPPPTTAVPMDLSRLPPQLDSLQLDALVLRGGVGRLIERCGELVPLARASAAAEQRPGASMVLGHCALAAGDHVTAAAEFQRMRERVAASLAPPGVWQGDPYYYAVGVLDAVAVIFAQETENDPEVVAETLEASADGHRLMDVIWLRDEDGRVQRHRVDITPSAERVMRYLSTQVPEQRVRDAYLAMAGHVTLNLQAEQVAAESRALVGRARVAERTGYFGGEAQARKDLERAATQEDAFGRYVYAEWLLRREAADAASSARATELLRASAQQGLPEAQILLALLCERPSARCERGEAKRLLTEAERAYGAAEVALQQHEVLQRVPGFNAKAARDALQRALRLGSVRALGVAAYEQTLAGPKPASREQRALDEVLRQGAEKNLAFALEMRAARRLDTASTPAERAAIREELRRAAALGSARAAARLGIAYALGEGVDKDAAEAATWHRLAAQRGDPAGQFNYATALHNGLGVEADKAEARVWYLRSAQQGYAASYGALGDIHALGLGIDADATAAAMFYAAGARLGHAYSQHVYASALWHGDGVDKDVAGALGWYEKAAAQGIADAEVALAVMRIDGNEVPRDVAAGVERLEACAQRGATACISALADLHSSGPTEVRDLPRALVLYETAAERNEAHALRALGWHYEHGTGVTADPARAFGYYSRCANLAGEDAGDCIDNLGRAYQKGIGTTRDPVQAAAMFRRAHERGSALGTCDLGEAVRDGYGVAADEAAAAQLFATAARAGVARCQLLHARRLLADPAESRTAMEWLHKAADGGEALARIEIVRRLMRQDSPLHDEAAGLAYAERCAADGYPPCLGEAGLQLKEQTAAAARTRGRALMERAAQAGDRRSAMWLGLAAYHGNGEPRDDAAARRWLTLAGPYEFAPGHLARLDARAGDIAAARRGLIEQAANGNMLARFQLIGLCATAGAHCGADAPTASAWLAAVEADGERFGSELFNDVAWMVATDPLAPRSDALLLIDLNGRARYGLRTDDAAHVDTWAALLARAGRTKEACEVQQRVLTLARNEKTEAAELLTMQQRRQAYCRGLPWDQLD